MNDFVSERIIEDILCSDKSILSEILSVNASDLSLVARQKTLKSGKLDMLCLHKDELLLVELKYGGFSQGVVRQINAYAENLRELQAEHRLICSEIRKIILVTEAKQEDVQKSETEGIRLLIYKPELVLSRYYENFKELSYFLTIRAGDYGVVRLGFLKPVLFLVSQGKGVKEICQTERKSEKTIRNRLSVAVLLSLVVKYKQNYFISDFGSHLLGIGDAKTDDNFNEVQIETLASFITENPFYSSITYTILAVLESVFVLAKNTHPVPRDAVKDCFVKSVGKEQTWKTSKSRETATYIFTNYACELGFLVKVNNEFYITPNGLQTILLLQLNRSIKLIEARKRTS